MIVPVKIDIFYRLKRHLSQQPVERVVIGIMCTFVLIAAIFYAIPSKPSSFFQNFADTTNDIFKKIDNVDLPAASSIMKHTVACRRAANMIQGSPAFKSHGSQIAKGLRKFGEKIMEAGHLLQKMYSKGSSVYKSFDMEIEAMMNRLNSNYIRRGEASYFKERINVLITKIKEFRKLVQQTHTSIHNAENIRHDTEGYIFDGLREAENFIANNNHCRSVDISKAKKELWTVNNILNHLHKTAVHLDMMDYEDKLMDISAELDKVGGTYDFFEVTKSDLRYLKYAVENSKSSLYKFHKKALVSN
ncbi:uncharacterized protein OCT59_022562 [Rhizophagus irregularis]|uniref:Uncharacterized protein n=3 Tax=Rhizophagus irregularis TaxID=588596 RepID=A0A015N5A0_RHIIW|nr:hypothetical protein RirG_052170 [Rhizophagus irregularis DAOM 197198w]UZO29069.1 hypothetical protein OCT59_022562 [Rhizophagus irregularis]